jgi:hypothetical protein
VSIMILNRQPLSRDGRDMFAKDQIDSSLPCALYAETKIRTYKSVDI